MRGRQKMSWKWTQSLAWVVVSGREDGRRRESAENLQGFLQGIQVRRVNFFSRTRYYWSTYRIIKLGTDWRVGPDSFSLELLKNQTGLITVCWQIVSEDIGRACDQVEMGRRGRVDITMAVHNVLSWLFVDTGKGEEETSFSLTRYWVVVFFRYSLKYVKS